MVTRHLRTIPICLKPNFHLCTKQNIHLKAKRERMGLTWFFSRGIDYRAPFTRIFIILIFFFCIFFFFFCKYWFSPQISRHASDDDEWRNINANKGGKILKRKFYIPKPTKTVAKCPSFKNICPFLGPQFFKWNSLYILFSPLF